MNKQNIVVIDYGLGNLFSVQRALEYCSGSNIIITSSADVILNADKLILPGVGAFEDGMRGLRELGLIEPIKKHIQNKKPMLGICLGMQLLASKSTEFGNYSGLDLIPGKVIPIPNESECGTRRKIPFIGWSALNKTEKLGELDPILSVISGENAVYFLHSYYFCLDNPDDLLASYEFQGKIITAAVKSGNTYGFQFHPEKSGAVGLNLLKAFLDLKN